MGPILSRNRRRFFLAVVLSLCFFIFWGFGGTALTQLTQPPPPPPVPGTPSMLEDIRNTRHNLSSIPPPDQATFERLYGPDAERRVYSVGGPEGTTEVCIFCHTPHGASVEAASQVNAPLWNRNLSSARYILYDQVWSTSFEAYELNPPQPNAPTGYSRLCLSCHDGTIALGTVLNGPGSGSPGSVRMSYAPGQTPAGGIFGRVPEGSGGSTGDTRFIGTNLQNDHPISFVYDSTLALRDAELVDPGPPLIAPQKIGDPTPISPLRRYAGSLAGRYDSVQCTSCHNPHAVTFPKFLRANYYNEPENPGTGKILCLYCHDKPGWDGSAHDADVFYPPPNPSQNNPYNYDGSHTVGQLACRACHDPHTAQGSKRILREGTDLNGNLAIENTCFLCHRPKTENINAQFPVSDDRYPPDVRSEFGKDDACGTVSGIPCGSAMSLTLSQAHQPVFVARSQEGVELFSPAPPPFNEETPGSLIPDAAHVECVDCHNPHQVNHANRFKGMRGIDINGNVVGANIPGNSREPYVFEVCLRCHGNSYTNLFTGDRFPDDTTFRSDPLAGTPANGSMFSLRGYSNKRKEFDPNTPDLSPDHTQQLKNASFHPVAAPGRNGSAPLCKQLALAFNLRHSVANPGGTVGNCDSDPEGTLSQITIQCTDCHNNNAFENVIRGPLTGLYDGTSYKRATDSPAAPNPNTWSNASMPSIDVDPSKPQGPHGSDYIRILRARYNTDIRNPARCFGDRNPGNCLEGDGFSSAHYSNFRLCFQCHDERAFNPFLSLPVLGGVETVIRTPNGWTNFVGQAGVPDGVRAGSVWLGNLHQYHLYSSGAYCHECHYNVHSNVEARNTIYGNGNGGEIPPDSEDGMNDNMTSTHLLNFGPTVSGKTFSKPRWYQDSDGSGRMRCDLVCHNVDMSSCFYQVLPGTGQCLAGSCDL